MKSNSAIIFMLLLCLCHASCNSGNATQESAPNVNSAHVPTELPIMLEKLTEDQHRIINELNSKDTSSYLVKTRPVLFQIQGVENDADEIRYTRPIYEPVDVMIYSLFEEKDGKLVDHGWIENESGDIIWEAKYENSTHGGGDPRNRKIVDYITLAPDHYRLRFISNSSHAVGDWHGAPPEREFYYGITVFNLNAIQSMNSAFNEQ